MVSSTAFFLKIRQYISLFRIAPAFVFSLSHVDFNFSFRFFLLLIVFYFFGSAFKINTVIEIHDAITFLVCSIIPNISH
jgi:hypothetical protein